MATPPAATRAMTHTEFAAAISADSALSVNAIGEMQVKARNSTASAPPLSAKREHVRRLAEVLGVEPR